MSSLQSSICNINTQIRRPLLHNNHPDRTTLLEMVHMLQQRTHLFRIHKVCVHFNIKGIENVDELAKKIKESEHKLPSFPHEDAHSIPYFLQNDFWFGNMSHTPYKGPIQHLQKYLTKYYNIFFLEYLEENFST